MYHVSYLGSQPFSVQGMKEYSFKVCIEGESPQMGHARLCCKAMRWKSMPKESNVNRQSVSSVPVCVRYLMTSAACMHPIMPTAAPSTPTVEHVSTSSSAGGSGKRHL